MELPTSGASPIGDVKPCQKGEPTGSGELSLQSSRLGSISRSGLFSSHYPLFFCLLPIDLTLVAGYFRCHPSPGGWYFRTPDLCNSMTFPYKAVRRPFDPPCSSLTIAKDESAKGSPIGFVTVSD